MEEICTDIEQDSCYEINANNNHVKENINERLEVHDLAYNICKEYMRGPWAVIPKSDLQVTVLGGGLTNKLYICHIPGYWHAIGDGDYPQTIVLRLYGLIIQDYKAQMQESVVFSILSERKIGPQLYAVFPGGRLEQYIPCRTLVTTDLPSPDISRQIARRMAEYHQMVMPLKKEPSTFMDKLHMYYESLQHVRFDDDSKSRLLSKFREFNIEKEIEFVKKLIVETNSPVVFCHNDVQEGNLLQSDRTDGNTNPIQMIDFEYSSYNYRGFDIGNHFCEWMYDYSHSEWPFFTSKPQHYPTRSQQVNFLQSYITEFLSTSNSNYRAGIFDIDFMLKEAERFALLSHLFWALWSVLQAKMSDIGFGYMEYAIVRMDAYFRQKEQIE